MENEEYIYEKNIRNIRHFYKSDDYSTFIKAGKEGLIKAKACINVIYDDPDISDKKLYVDLAKKLKVFGTSEKPENQVKKIYGAYTLSYTMEGKTIKMSSDALCGWKQLYLLRKGDISWLDDYKAMREYTAAYLVWPKHNAPTINTLRYTVFNDRVDYTLFDIRKFFDCKKRFDKNKNEKQLETDVRNTCKLHKAYLNPKGDTRAWLMTFHGFKEFIDKMYLDKFVNISTYNVLNLEEDNNNEITDYGKSYCFNDKYVEHLKRIIKT